MLESIIEYVANNSTRVTYADGNCHNFILVWGTEVLNVIWDNHASGINTINGYRLGSLEDVFSDKEIKRMEFILRKHLTTKD